MGRTLPRGRPDRQIAGAAIAALSFRTLQPRHLGVPGLSGVLYAVDGGILARQFRSRTLAQALPLARHLLPGERNRRQKLYRPKPGIRAVRDRARLSGRDVPAGEQDLAGAAAR